MINKNTFFAITLVFLMHPYWALAGIDLPWSTTYEGPEWKQSDGSDTGTFGVQKHGDWVAQLGGYEEQITLPANNPNGGGGRGQRHWTGDGTNNNSGNTKVFFNNPPSKIWFRWYSSWENGWNYSWGAAKQMYLWSSSGKTLIICHYGSGTVSLGASGHDVYWNNVGTGYSFFLDGTWSYFEMMIDLPGGAFKFWINGNLVIDDPYYDYRGITDIANFYISSNTKDVSNGRPMYQDFDDIAISTTGYIGPLAGGSVGQDQDTTAPSVSITSPVQGQTVAGNVAVSASASDNVGVSGVQFKIDGADFGSEDATAPYSINVDTTAVPDGSYTLTALARDAVGNQTTTSPVNISVSNASGTVPGDILFSESFEDTNFSTRGWYDNTNIALDSSEYAPGGSTASAKFHFQAGNTNPDAGSPARHAFAGSEDIEVEFDVKYSLGWQGSGTGDHPHEMHVASSLDGDWDGMGYAYLMTYIEENGSAPRLSIQDGKNVNTTYGTPLIDLTGTTEDRSVAGCNGSTGDAGTRTDDCYQYNGQWMNHKVFQHSSAALTPGNWHHVKVHFKLNTVGTGTTNTDGILQYWLNGTLIMDYNNVVFRTSHNPTVNLNKYILAPYIGVGSPIDQTMWVDNLVIATPTTSTTIAPPSNFRSD